MDRKLMNKPGTELLAECYIYQNEIHLQKDFLNSLLKIRLLSKKNMLCIMSEFVKH